MAHCRERALLLNVVKSYTTKTKPKVILANKSTSLNVIQWIQVTPRWVMRLTGLKGRMPSRATWTSSGNGSLRISSSSTRSSTECCSLVKSVHGMDWEQSRRENTWKFFYNEGSETLAQIAQRGGGWPIPGIRFKVRLDRALSTLIYCKISVPMVGELNYRAFGRSLPTQTISWFYKDNKQIGK